MITFARYRAGIVGESQRISHVFHVHEDGTMPEAVTSLCGRSFPPGLLEHLPAWSGMPCLACTINMPADQR
jgi:hypothetical protein